MLAPDIRILDEPFNPEGEARRLRAKAEGAGAVVTFTGLVRPDSAGLIRLALEHCPGLTEKEIARFATETMERWPLDALVIRHRVGEMAPAEPIVFVGAAAKHRRPAFEAADCVMDYLKSGAPFWKREITADGERWVEPRAEDHDDLQRWKARS